MRKWRFCSSRKVRRGLEAGVIYAYEDELRRGGGDRADLVSSRGVVGKRWVD